MSEARPQKRRGGRIGRILRSLLVISVTAVVLASWNAYTTRRDIAVATGAPSENQKAFFLAAAERPDIATFFKNLKPAQRVRMAQNLGSHRAPEIAKVIGILLADFDPRAREALTISLIEMAKAHPEAVAVELKHKGSFQSLGVARALREAGPRALKPVIEQLRVGDARPNAIAFLVASGPPAVPLLLPMLEDKEKDVRLAAADALGKLRSREAVAPLTARYQSSEGDERLGYLTALSGIGAPETEELMAAAFNDRALHVPARAQAALGLGRIGTPSAVALLWRYVRNEDAILRSSVVSALQLAADVALTTAPPDPAATLEVAAGIRTPRADSVIAKSLNDPTLRLAAAEAAADRPDLVTTLQAALNGADPVAEGEFMDALVRSLGTTPEGAQKLAAISDPARKGFIARRANISGL